MKKVLLAFVAGYALPFIIFAALSLMAFTAWSAPFLVCDPQEGVVGYTLTGLTDLTIAAQQDGSLKYDLAAIQSGTYNVQVAACNVWGCSSTVPFVFTKQLPTAPVGVRLLAK